MNENTNITPIIGKEYPQKAIEMIKKANNSIKIIVFDWRWYPIETGSSVQQFNHEIIKAHNRGCEVKAICNMSNIVELLKREGIKIKKLETKKLVHAKLMIIDDKNIIIGSHNYTQNAFTLNHELSVVITNCPVVQRFIDYFNNLYK